MREPPRNSIFVAACTSLLIAVFVFTTGIARAERQLVLAVRATKTRPVQDARQLFVAKQLPADLPSSSVGSYWNGCVAGARQLPVSGAHWQVMRPSRNRNWGHPRLIDYIEKLADRAYKDGWSGLLVGNMSMPRGGPTPGHGSHQSGLDVDIWLTPAPDHDLTSEERETMGAPSVINSETAQLEPSLWTQQHADFVRNAAQDPNVALIFVTPAIKQYLCKNKDRHGADARWLRRLQPYWGHDDHIHVRLSCDRGDKFCRNQALPTTGDGCGKEVSDWMRIVKRKRPKASKPSAPKPVALSSMPQQCRKVLEASP
jgi:penicillin-insensitive murein endopeptidase